MQELTPVAIKAGVRLARRLYTGATLQVRGARGQRDQSQCEVAAG